MIVLPEIDPVAFEIGPLAVRWYGLMYVIGFAAALVLGTSRARRKNSPMTPAQFQDLAFYAIIGLLIGDRLGYMIFYDSSALIRAPLEIIKVWHGGMFFHGGLLGIVAAGKEEKDVTQAEVERVVSGIDGSAVNVVRKRLRLSMESDAALKQQSEDMAGKLSRLKI